VNNKPKLKMKTTILKIAVCVLLAAPVLSRAQDTNGMAAPATTVAPLPLPPVVAAPPAEIPATNAPAPAKPKKVNTTLVATGKVLNVDTNAMTLTVGKRTFELTSETRITKAGKPAILSDIAVDEKVGIAYKKTGGKFDAITINAKKSEKSDGETNSVSEMK
jgi:hypothetical protein